VFPGGLAVGLDDCKNMITLSRDIHADWNHGNFALKPISLSSDHKTLQLAVFIQEILLRQENANLQTDPIALDLCTDPPSTEGLCSFHPTRDEELTCIPKHLGGELGKVRTGDIITLKTSDPERLPLPDWDLLLMQWKLHRLVRLSGAAEISCLLNQKRDHDPHDQGHINRLDRSMVPSKFWRDDTIASWICTSSDRVSTAQTPLIGC
jgi:hypothetical protein